ncbi:MAG: universal stress protein [Salinivirgaceae bacterium]|nr:universal stress protein [Salinivirgaceae bacterium]MDD4747960.1 universal stress protein [Salinivirgaceae bacterium]MDY0279632.1 universal stress protein [Salinivirgaceae bacterium]
MLNGKNIIVTWDFTEMSDFAAAHAVKLVKHLQCNMRLLHIMKKESEREEAEPKLLEEARKINETYGILPSTCAITGDIFRSIGDYTSDSENDVNLVVMGTHGMRGMQKFTGSWALKVITSSTVPFIVVQDMPTDKKLTDVVFPLDFKAENKEKLVWAIYLAQYFTLKIHIFKEPIEDEYYLKKINSNLIFARKYLAKYGIEHEIHTAKTKGHYETQLIEFAHESEADLILVMTTKNIGIADYVFGASEQAIIANNAKVPIMCVNPRNDLMRSNFWS